MCSTVGDPAEDDNKGLYGTNNNELADRVHAGCAATLTCAYGGMPSRTACTRSGSTGGLEATELAEKSDEDFAAQMLQIRGGKVKASEAKKITDGTTKLTDNQIYDQIDSAARSGLYSTIFDHKQVTEYTKATLRRLGYRILDEKYNFLVTWNG